MRQSSRFSLIHSCEKNRSHKSIIVMRNIIKSVLNISSFIIICTSRWIKSVFVNQFHFRRENFFNSIKVFDISIRFDTICHKLFERTSTSDCKKSIRISSRLTNNNWNNSATWRWFSWIILNDKNQVIVIE